MVRPRIVEIGGGGLASLREQASGYDANGDGNPSSGVPERRPFLKRGEGRLGMTSLPTSTVKEVLHALGDKPAASRKAHPVKRSLSLERPASARSASSNSDTESIEEEAPRRTSYTSLLAQRENLRKSSSAGMRPSTAPAKRSKSPEEPALRNSKNVVHASALSTAEGKRLQSMIRPMLLATGRGTPGLSSSPNTSNDGMSTIAAAERTGSHASRKEDWNLDAASAAIMQKARVAKPDVTRILTYDMMRDGAMTGGEAQAAERKGGPGHTVVAGPQRAHTAVDFSPVLQAVQGKLAALTQENIGLKEAVKSLQHQLSEVDQQYEARLEATEAKLQQEKEEEVRRITQALRIRERQHDAFGKKDALNKCNKQIETLQKEVRVAKQDVHARESVLNQTIDKLKKNIARLEVEKTQLQERVHKLSADKTAQETCCGGLKTELQLLREELNITIAENARIRGVRIAEAGAMQGLALTSALPTSALRLSPNSLATKNASMNAGISQQVARASAVRHAWLGGQQDETSRPDALSPVKNIKRFAAPVPSACHINSGGPGGPGGCGGARAAAHAVKGGGHVSGGAIGAAHVPASSTSALNMSSTRALSMSSSEVTEVFGGERLMRLEEAERREETKSDGTRAISYRNGSVKEMLPDGRVVTRFANGDVKEECPDGSSTYFYREANTTHITYKDGLQLIHFPNNQMERHYPDGSREVVFADKTRKRYSPKGDLQPDH